MAARIRCALQHLIPFVLIVCAATAMADPGPPPAGYQLQRVSDAVPAASLAGISQLAFRPGDPAHLYAARPFTANVITRYDYDPVTGLLSNAADITAVLPPPHGLAFRGDALYVSLYTLNDSRITRLRDVDQNGVFEERIDFVRGVPTGDHAIDQLQIFGSALFAGIGVRKNAGRPRLREPLHRHDRAHRRPRPGQLLGRRQQPAGHHRIPEPRAAGRKAQALRLRRAQSVRAPGGWARSRVVQRQRRQFLHDVLVVRKLRHRYARPALSRRPAGRQG